MAIINCAECGNSFSDKASACPHCGCPIEYAKPQSNISEPVAHTEHSENDARKSLLRDYLEKIRLLETDIYTLTELVSKLYPLIKPYPEKMVINPPNKPLPPNSPYLWGELEIFKEMPILSFLYSPISAYEKLEKIKKRNKRRQELNAKAQERYKQNTEEYHELLLPEYEKQMAEYVEKVKEEELRHDREVAQIKFFNEGIAEQIELAKKEKEHTEEALSRLYDIGIIFPKYRGIVPVTMFCEYMDSGRRTELEGIHGMYDLYEQDLLGKKIVDSVNEVNSSLSYISYQISGIADQLSGIARNQILLHEEIARGNEISKIISQDISELLSQSTTMLSSTEEIDRKLSAIQKTSEMSVYNTEVTARRVDAIAKIEEYEFSLRRPMFPSL